MPLFEPTLVYALRAHMLEQIRRDVIGAADLAVGRDPAAPPSSPSASPTWSSSPASARRSPPRSWAWSAGRFEEMASGRRRAAGAAGEDDRRRGDAGLRRARADRCARRCALIDAAEAEGEEFPFLRAGVACGPTVPQSGDYYGRAVNLASRITGVARPGSVVVDEATKDGGGRRLQVHLHRRAPPEGDRLPGQALPRRASRAPVRRGCGRSRAGCRRARPAGAARAGACRPSAGRCSCGRRSCASPRGPLRARRSPRPCAAPSPRRWRAAPRRRRGAPRSRPSRSRRRRSAGAKAWTSTSPSSAWPSDCSASGTSAAAGADQARARPGRASIPARFGTRREAVAVARGLAGEGDHPAGPQDAAEFGEGALEVGDVVEDGVAEDEVEALVLEGQLLGLGDRRLDARGRAPRRSPRGAAASRARCRSRSAARSRRAAAG